ncbi:MAG: CoB--CoM heterodisulfide reductase iron-sulfur subunit B family protein [Chloroflexi bacterium]|nr:CoB--CoM heterodisulfide reductase iron-sulfur subunit B family protein [Chloroflexota bacterium]
MLRKGKLKVLPEIARPAHRPNGKKAQPAPNQVAYYPGCTLHSTAVEFDLSTRSVCRALEIELVEPEGWLCCGASAAHRIDSDAAVRLPMQTLALIQQDGFREAALPCAACFNRFRTAQHELAADPELRTRIAGQVGSEAGMEVAVRSMLDFVVERVGLEAVGARVTRPLEGLKVACYYGCLLTRPPEITGAKDPEYPMAMDHLMTALGATPLDWGGKTSCCGASLSLTRTDIVLDLSARILDEARAAGADAVAVACPLCHANLDGRQHQMPHPSPLSLGESGEGLAVGGGVPVLYFTQLMALAFGLGEKAAALAKNMVDPRPALAEKGVTL